jgi:hypothetical protein
MRERPTHVGCGSRGSDADDEITATDPVLAEIFDRPFEAILGPFLGPGQRGMPAGDDALDHFRVRSISRWHLARIKDAKATGSAGPDIEEPAAAPKGRFGHFDCPGQLLTLGMDRGSDCGILGVDEIDDFHRRREVDIRGARIAPLGNAGIEEVVHVR